MSRNSRVLTALHVAAPRKNAGAGFEFITSNFARLALPAAMAIDRTRDFMSLVSAISAAPGGGATSGGRPFAPPPAPPAVPVPETKGAFTRAIGEVSRGIQSTSAMLRHLTKRE